MTAPDVTSWAVPVPIGYRVGDWEVTEPIATGNFGSVYGARWIGGDPLDADVALKFMPVSRMGHREFREMWQLARREVEFSADASHERLIAIIDSLVVHDADVEFDGAVVLVMERARQSLQDVLDDATPGEPLPDAGRLIVEICEGLQFLHASSWVYGDLKPSNLLLMADGSIRLGDFGLVARLDGTHGYGAPFGSIDYQPPERSHDQLGEQGVRIRPSADVWALGVTAYQILTGGSLPLAGSTPGARAAAAQEFAAGRAPLRLQNDLASGWRDFVARCLAADPAKRPSAVELLEHATRLAGQEVQIYRRRRRWIWTLAAPLAGLAVVAGAGGGWWAWNSEHGPVLRVYNVETDCLGRTDRVYSCSLGLALNPYAPYEAGNVSKHRVWHGDALTGICVVYDGVLVADEYGVTSQTYYRVVVDSEPSGYAWLPAVRTRSDVSSLPRCK